MVVSTPVNNFVGNSFFHNTISFHSLIAATARACSPPSSRGSKATPSEGNVLSYIIAEYVPNTLCSLNCVLFIQFQFHKVWGQLMKTGYQNSRFAHQVHDG